MAASESLTEEKSMNSHSESEEKNNEEGELSEDFLFTLDNTPTTKNDIDVPTYNQNYTDVLKEKEKHEEEKAVKSKGAGLNVCFNCAGNHVLSDCPDPKDYAAINRNRRMYMAKRNTGASSKGNQRYHVDEEQRFAHLVPGKISQELSEALGLEDNELPLHIYKMRQYGYPPGWLEDARVSHSGISLFGSGGEEVAHPEDEEGEIIGEGSRDKFDSSKIIDFPGFNVPCDSGVQDSHAKYNLPPINWEQSKEVMLSQLQHAKSYKRMRKFGPPASRSPCLAGSSSSASSSPATMGMLADMEVEDVSDEPTILQMTEDDGCRFIPPLPRETPPKPPPPPDEEPERPPGDDSEAEGQGASSQSSSRAQSPSLSDLEAQKSQLLAALEDGGSSSGDASRLSKLVQEQAGQESPSPSGCSTSVNPSTPVKPGSVKSVSLGTPSMTGASPYTSLPSPAAFSRDICDVINFENLPDSTGKYEKMSGLIKKVRKVVSKLHQDEYSAEQSETP